VAEQLDDAGLELSDPEPVRTSTSAAAVVVERRACGDRRARARREVEPPSGATLNAPSMPASIACTIAPTTSSTCTNCSGGASGRSGSTGSSSTRVRKFCTPGPNTAALRSTVSAGPSPAACHGHSQLLDLALVLGVGEAGRAAQRARLGERDVVVGVRAVGDDGGEVDDAADAGGTCRLSTFIVPSTLIERISVEVADRIHLEREVDDDVDAVEQPDERRVAHVDRAQLDVGTGAVAVVAGEARRQRRTSSPTMRRTPLGSSTSRATSARPSRPPTPVTATVVMPVP
jgi:hypothetical protein